MDNKPTTPSQGQDIDIRMMTSDPKHSTLVLDQSTGTAIELPSSQPSLKKSPDRNKFRTKQVDVSPLKLSLNVVTKGQLSPNNHLLS